MQTTDPLLDIYGTAPRRTADDHALITPSPSKHPSPNNVNKEAPQCHQEALEARTRMRAYHRYKDRNPRTDLHFNLYKRLVPLSNIHTRNNLQNPLDNNAVHHLVHIINTHGWSHNLANLIVTDDSIVPPDGPGTNIRSYSLPPTFSILHGHPCIHALDLALKQGTSVPDKILVEVAVPMEGTSIGDTEVRLLEMTMRLNRFTSHTRTSLPQAATSPTRATPQKRASPRRSPASMSPRKNNASENAAVDFRRILMLQTWLKASPKYRDMTTQCVGRGDISRASLEAVEKRVFGDGTSRRLVQAKHMIRYIRVALVFDHAPNLFELYKRKVAKKHLLPSIVTLSSANLVRAEPPLKLLIFQCLCACLDKRQKRFRDTQDTMFVRNIVELYDGLKRGAANLGYNDASFLNVVVALQSEENGAVRTSTIRKTIIEKVNTESMCTDQYNVSALSARLEEALTAAKREGKSRPLSTPDLTDTLTLPSTEKPLHEREIWKAENGHQRFGEEPAEETSSMCLTHADARKLYPNINPCEESSNVRSEESEAEDQEQVQMLRETHITMKNIKRGQKRLGSPEPLSILRQKVLKRNRPPPSNEIRRRNPNGDVLHNSNLRNKVYKNIPDSGLDTFTTTFPACIPENHLARRYLNGKDLQSLRGELWAYSSETSCAHHGTFKEIHNRGLGASVLQCIQFTAFWSDHKAALDEKGYTQIKIPSPRLISSAKKHMRNTTSGDVDGKCLYPKTCKEAMVIETVLAVISEWLGLYNVENGLPSHAMSEKGCSVLLLEKDRKAHKPRLAFGLRSDTGDSKPWNPPTDPSYMFVVTTESGLPIWVWERAHVMLSGPSELLPVFAKQVRPQRVCIEPQSVFLCRGDVVHTFGATSELEGYHPADPVAVFGHLVQRSVDQREQPTYNGWWMKFISGPDS